MITVSNIESEILKEFVKIPEKSLRNITIVMDEDTELLYRIACTYKTLSVNLPLNWGGFPIIVANNVEGFEIVVNDSTK